MTAAGQGMRAQSGEIGVGPTEALCLRVSVAALARVVFPHPESGQNLLALERKATLRAAAREEALVIAQPFGGGLRILRPDVLLEQVGDFHYDSLRSREEQDFRILIRPADWGAFKQFCLNAFRAAIAGEGGLLPVLEADPARELAEEFQDTLQAALSPAQYRLHPLEMRVEDEPAPSHSPRAANLPTVRIYNVFEAVLTDAALIERVQASSAGISDEELARQAVEDARQGGRGRANAALALPVEQVRAACESRLPENRDGAIRVAGHALAGNVSAVLGKYDAPGLERFPW